MFSRPISSLSTCILSLHLRSSTHTGLRLDAKYTAAEQVVIFSKLDCCHWCHLGASVLDIPLSGVPHTLLFACSFIFLEFAPSVQFCRSVVPTLCDPMNRSTPGLPVHHKLPEFTQTHIHQVGDAIQPSHPQSSPSPPAPNPSQHQGLFQ